MSKVLFNEKTFEDLLDISKSLSSERDLDRLLDKILSEARRFTCSDAGTIYLVNNNKLIFMLSQVQTLFDRWGEQQTREKFKKFEMPITKQSMAGYAAITGMVLNIPDVNKISPDKEYKYNASFDEQNDYKTVSMLVVPMKNRQNQPIGVLQLINAFGEDKKVIAYTKSLERLVESLASMAGIAIQNAQLNQEIRNAHLDTILRLGIAAEYRDKETANHIRRMARYSLLIAESLGWNKETCERLLYAAPMHDVGKLGIPDEILHKPGVLTTDERETMQKHTLIGANILHHSRAEELVLSKLIALTHHEKWDGSGYPQGLKQKEIPIEGRIAAITDVFDALSSRRCYKEPFPEEKVIEIMKHDSGRHFDPELTELFLSKIVEIRSIQIRYQDTDADFDKLRNINALSPADLIDNNKNSQIKFDF
ncbi:MAG: hypothetical protein A2096_16320 [Spirochaetes bacterium GWF1_41_5]|nr:MAG: hypothetical protein A2096_16320 [Spirochaetes bacterium GWF1_41_5]HBE04566.1 diguanylate cyclase [Spirochaetia bacterium]